MERNLLVNSVDWVLLKVRLGVTEHVDGAQLDIGIGEHAGGESEQSREVVVYDDHDRLKPLSMRDRRTAFPFLEVFAPVTSEATDTLFFPSR